MPDQADVEQALAALIADALYPDGVSAAGAECRVFRGWPVASALEADVAAGLSQIAVQAMPGTQRDRTRYQADEQAIRAGAPTLTVESGLDWVAFGGVAGVGQVAGLRVDGRAYAYRARDGDTVGVVAAALAGLVRADRPALLAGPRITLAGGRGVCGRVAADGAAGRELRRQVMAFRIAVWAPGWDVRDRVCGRVDAALAAVGFLDVGGWGCQVRGAAGASTDEGSAAGLWRRDLGVLVEFPTVLQGDAPTMLFGVGSENGAVVVV